MINPYFETDKGKLYHGDCLEIMPMINDKIDMILCDLTYGTIACSWDDIIPFKPLWTQYKRMIKNNSAIVLTASQPFTSKLVMSNIEMFKYEWIWNKVLGANVMQAKYQPMKIHENILVFGQGNILYNPIITKANPINIRSVSFKKTFTNIYDTAISNDKCNITNRFPQSILTYNKRKAECNTLNISHPTQKPIVLFEYLIKTYTNENNIIMDNCIGSGTTAVACEKMNRRWIGIEISKEYCDIAVDRIKKETAQYKMDLTYSDGGK